MRTATANAEDPKKCLTCGAILQIRRTVICPAHYRRSALVIPKDEGSQLDRLEKLMRDYKPHRTDEIVEKVYGPRLSLSRVGARIWDFKNKRLKEGETVESFRDPDNHGLWFYQLVPPPMEQRQLFGRGLLRT